MSPSISLCELKKKSRAHTVTWNDKANTFSSTSCLSKVAYLQALPNCRCLFLVDPKSSQAHLSVCFEIVICLSCGHILVCTYLNWSGFLLNVWIIRWLSPGTLKVQVLWIIQAIIVTMQTMATVSECRLHTGMYKQLARFCEIPISVEEVFKIFIKARGSTVFFMWEII